MILLVDASAAVDLLVRSDAGARVRRLLENTNDTTLMTVAHLDAEVLSALVHLNRGEVLTSAEVTSLLDRLATMAMQRLAITGSLLREAWGLQRQRLCQRRVVRRRRPNGPRPAADHRRAPRADRA